MQIKAKKAEVNNNQISLEDFSQVLNNQELSSFVEFGLGLDEYREGIKSMAEFCGKITALRSVGLSPTEAVELIFTDKAFTNEVEKKKDIII